MQIFKRNMLQPSNFYFDTYNYIILTVDLIMFGLVEIYSHRKKGYNLYQILF
jgi:hypothetical protein